MAGETPEVTDLLQRIEQLERAVEGLQRDRSRAEATPFASWRKRRTVRQTVEAEEFIVCDSRKNRRAKLGMSRDGWVRLRLYAEGGERCLSLGVPPEGGARLRLYNQGGEPRAGLAVFPDEMGEGLVLNDQAGNPRMTISLIGGGAADLRILDESGEVLWKAP